MNHKSRQHAAPRAMTPEERHKVLYEWNDTQVPYDQASTLHALISTRAAEFPERTAVVCEDQSLTYAELEARSSQLARHLISLGVTVESLVGLHMNRSLEMVVGILGILKAGGAYVPIDPEYPAARIHTMIADAGAQVMVTQEDLLRNLDSTAYQIVCLDRDWPAIAVQQPVDPAVPMQSDNLVYVIYTSGSTGKPKGAQNVHRSIVNVVSAMARRIGITHQDRILATTTLSFDPSVWEIFLPLTQGARLVVASQDAIVDGQLLQRVIDREAISFMRSTPTGWRLYLDSGWRGGPSLKILSGGETLTLNLARALLEHCAELWHSYGPAEAGIFCTMGLIPRDVEEITIGRPYDNIRIYILDEEQQPVPPGALGELYIAGAGVGRGYLNRPELTAERFLPEPFVQTQDGRPPTMYRTGDLARFREDGQILFAGRNDSQVKIRGRRIELGDIESALSSHPLVKNNAILAHKNGADDLQLVAYVVPLQGRPKPAMDDLRDFLRQRLPEYMVPARYVFMSRLPVSPNGKLDRQALPPPEHFPAEPQRAYVAPRGQLEQGMERLFAEVLRLQRVSVADNFFDLGGNSLLAARLVYRAQEQFGASLSVRDFLDAPDIAGFCQVVLARRAAEPALTGAPADSPAAAPPIGQLDPRQQELLQRSNLTQGQFLMWMGQQKNPNAPIYNVVHAFVIDGALDTAAFRRAFQALVDNHDTLRTVIHEVTGVPRQQVLEQVEASLELIDFSGEPDAEATLQAFLATRQERVLPFDQPLFDAALLKLASGRFVWYFAQHHILTDAVSSELLFKRLGRYYQLALQGSLAELPQPPQYADFVASERVLRQDPAYQKAVAYWQNKYAEPLPPAEFYGRTPQGETTHTTRVTQALGSERTAQLRAIAAQPGFASPSEDLSLFTIFAALLFTTLHRLNGQERLRLGTPYHGRPTAESLDVAGLFIEMGVLQVDIEEGETFRSLGEKVRAEILDGLAHVQPGISTAAVNRAYNIILNFIQATYSDFAGLPVHKLPLHSRHIDANHHLRLQITDYVGGGDFVLYFDMETARFGQREQAWFVRHFLRVVDQFIANHQQPIGAFSLLSDEERQLLLLEFNATDAPYPGDQSVVQLFETQAARSPLAEAAVEGGRTISYGALNERANRLAHLLQEQGVGAETAVAICMERSIDVLTAIWGTLKAGGFYIPIDPAYPAERKKFMLEDAGAALVLVNDAASLGAVEIPQEARLLHLSDSPLDTYPSDNLPVVTAPENLVYMIYTSGSTGTPKGTMITHRGLVNYASWARRTYQGEAALAFPLYSSLAFDLTVTSLFVPLISGGKVVVYRESAEAPGLEILSVFADDAVDVVKLTPAHLQIVRQMAFQPSRISRLIVGGEDFKTDLARAIQEQFPEVTIYNEYGPTEAVVGCMIHRYDPLQDSASSVPIGRPAANARIYLLDQYDQPVPPGVVGEMVISSDGVARGYRHRPELTAERFGDDPFRPGARIYRTGDIARWDEEGQLVFLGRRDHQVKIGSARIELGEIEAALRTFDGVQDAVVSVVQFEPHLEEAEIIHCVTCGLPSNYPDVTFDEAGICSLCRDFETFRDDVSRYFKPYDDLIEIVARAKADSSGEYDCLMLYSGGKDSTYVLTQLVEMGLRVLAFSLDNGYISAEAIENMKRITDRLGVDLVIGRTPYMNAIFADSLERHSNVCHGCYKVIYTLGFNLARQKGIKVIFTGLSRGQLFETRLDTLFRNRIFGVQEMDEAVLQARRIYHRVDDAVRHLLDVSIFSDDRVFQEIQIVDYFRYSQVELDEIYDYLSTRVPWIRPSDTGRSTNCLINEAGIYVHQTERGYHNYALPYSWDVRLGHKTREEAMEELDDEMRLPMVRQMLDEVGYTVKAWHADPAQRRLAAYVVAAGDDVSIAALRAHLGRRLPSYMMPAYIVHLEQMPLTSNGKVDRSALPDPRDKRPELDAAYVAPQTELEQGLAAIWSDILHVSRVGVHDDFFDLGGASIPAVQVVARISDDYGVAFPVRSFFEHPTIAGQSRVLEDLLLKELESLSDDEVERLLAEMDE